MKKHERKTEEELEIIVQNISELSYDSLSDFFEILSMKFIKDSENYKNSGKKILSHEIEMASVYVQRASESIERAWGISEKFVK